MHVQRPETSLKTKGDIMLGQNMYCRRTVGFGANGMAWGPGHSGGGGYNNPLPGATVIPPASVLAT